MSEQEQKNPAPVKPEDIGCSPPPEIPVMPEHLHPAGEGWANYLAHIKPQAGI